MTTIVRKELFNTMLALNTSAKSKMEKEMEGEFFIIVMEAIILDSGRIAKCMERGHCTMQMEV